MALPKKYRFSNRREIQDIMRYGQKRFLALGRLIFRTNAAKRGQRFLVVVPNSVSKKSTIRHRLKRQFESLFYLHRVELTLGLDAVLILNPNAAGLSKKELFSEFMKTIPILKRL